MAFFVSAFDDSAGSLLNHPSRVCRTPPLACGRMHACGYSNQDKPARSFLGASLFVARWLVFP